MRREATPQAPTWDTVTRVLPAAPFPLFPVIKLLLFSEDPATRTCVSSLYSRPQTRPLLSVYSPPGPRSCRVALSGLFKSRHHRALDKHGEGTGHRQAPSAGHS